MSRCAFLFSLRLGLLLLTFLTCTPRNPFHLARPSIVQQRGTTDHHPFPFFDFFDVVSFSSILNTEWGVPAARAQIREDTSHNESLIERLLNSTWKWPPQLELPPERQNQSLHTNNWAVLVGTSIFWHNYRHMANVLGMYRTVRRLGIPDSQIILMVADEMACNGRNSVPGTIFNHRNHNLNVYGTNVEVDYRGYDASVENFIRVLTGRHDPSVPRSKRMLSDAGSNIFIYLTGHGGEEFLKFQDYEEICSRDLADAFEQMWQGGRYNELLFVVDTCQATTLYRHFRSPNVLAVGSSSINENSYSHHTDYGLGLAMIDRFTYYTLDFFEKIKIDSKQTFADLFVDKNYPGLSARAQFRTDLFVRPLNKTLLTDFFGSVMPIELTMNSYPLDQLTTKIEKETQKEDLTKIEKDKDKDKEKLKEKEKEKLKEKDREIENEKESEKIKALNSTFWLEEEEEDLNFNFNLKTKTKTQKIMKMEFVGAFVGFAFIGFVLMLWPKYN